MLLDGSKYSEEGYIGEELLGGVEEERLQKCMAVQESIADSDFESYEETLAAYGVSDTEYKKFQAGNTLHNIFASFSIKDNHQMVKVYLEVFENMIFAFTPHHGHGDHAKKIVRELKNWSHELEH
ncbi:MAG: hypothetical protein JWR02_218 [Mucilaginibacter sp.]|nr:hypothetical protein [Mucilaginibacter sp.]